MAAVALRLADLAERLGGRAIEGDPDLLLSGVATLEDAGPADLGFVRSAAFADALARSKAGAVIAPAGLDVGGRPALRSPNPSLDFARAAGILVERARPAAGVHPSAVVAADAEIAASVNVGACAVIGARCRIGPRSVVGANVTLGDGVELGADCTLYAGAVVMDGVRIGDRVVLQPSCVIGGDGFGYEMNEAGAFEKVPQIGTVVIEDDVEIGACTTVDRARLGETRIGRGVKIDNLVQIGHNCVVGDHSIIVAQSGLAGSTTLEERVFMMAQSGAAARATLGRGSFVGVRGGVIESIEPGSRVYGFPSRPERTWHRAMSWFYRLPDLARRVRAIERKLGIARSASNGGSTGGDGS